VKSADEFIDLSILYYPLVWALTDKSFHGAAIASPEYQEVQDEESDEEREPLLRQ
jgi:hypothetical protein